MSRTRAEAFAQAARDEQLRADTLARAVAGRYAWVGPSGRAWSVDPTTGLPTRPAPDEEHQALRDLTASGHVDGAEPVWMRRTDGTDDIVSHVIPAPADDDTDGREAAVDPVEDARHAVGALPSGLNDADVAARGAGWRSAPDDASTVIDDGRWSR